MKLEGKLKDGFFEWLYKTYTEFYIQSDNYYWEGLPQSAQFGLIQEYADTTIYYTELIPEDELWDMVIGYEDKSKSYKSWEFDKYEGFLTRPEAQVAAVEKLNEIFNN